MKIVRFIALVACFMVILNANENIENIDSTESMESVESTESLKTAESMESTESANVAESTTESIESGAESTNSIKIIESKSLTDSTDSTNAMDSTDSTNLTESADSTQNSGIILQSTQDLSEIIKSYFTQNSEEKSLLDGISGHIGFFGKTNALGKNKDSYGIFSGSMELTHSFLDYLHLGVGIYGIAPFMDYSSRNSNNYITSKFVANSAFIKYEVEGFYDISAGRYKEDRDWLKHYIQGVGIDVSYDIAAVWVNWVDEQAHISREYLTNFDIYKKAYNKKWLVAAGLDLEIFGVKLAPYYYLMSKNFWAAGGKIALDFDMTKEWNTTTILHYAFLRANGDINRTYNDAHIAGSGLKKGDESSILWIDEAISWEKDIHSVLFGVGYIKVWDAYFELSNIGNMSRFETESPYDGNKPGGIYNGTNSTNMFEANTSTIYGFLGYKMDRFSTTFLGRYSKSSAKKQDLYSIGAKWKIIEGLYIGGVAAYMQENKTNMSFAKGFIEFAI